jgi:hypothetical protein
MNKENSFFKALQFYFETQVENGFQIDTDGKGESRFIVSLLTADC